MADRFALLSKENKRLLRAVYTEPTFDESASYFVWWRQFPLIFNNDRWNMLDKSSKIWSNSSNYMFDMNSKILNLHDLSKVNNSKQFQQRHDITRRLTRVDYYIPQANHTLWCLKFYSTYHHYQPDRYFDIPKLVIWMFLILWCNYTKKIDFVLSKLQLIS